MFSKPILAGAVACALLANFSPSVAAVAPAVQTPQPVIAPQLSPATSPAGTMVTIPGGSVVSVQLSGKISSSNANVGDTFAIRAAKRIVVDGWIVVEKDAPGQGEVLTVDRAGSHGHPGSIGIRMDWVFAADGEKIKLTSERRTSEGESKAGVSSTMTIISWAFLGLPGLFVHNFVKGRDVELDGSHVLDAYVDDTVHVVAKSKGDSAETGFAH